MLRRMLKSACIYVILVTGLVWLGGAIFTLSTYNYALPFLAWTVFYFALLIYLVAGLTITVLWVLTRIGLLKFMKKSVESVMISFDEAWS